MKTASGEEDPGVAMVIEYHFDNGFFFSSTLITLL
jgi:hypothetical protein